jgi:BMFP domain-containing protein YqiC
MIAVIIFIALASLSDGASAARPRMLPLSQWSSLCSKCRFHASPLASREGARCGAIEGADWNRARNWGATISAATKQGKSVVNRRGEPPVEIPKVEELLRSLMQGLPPGLASGASGLREDLENNFRAVLRANLGKLDLAGRDEFDAQRKVLERTRARLEELERRVAELEARAANSAGR